MLRGGEVLHKRRNANKWIRSGDPALIGLLLSDFLVSVAGTIVYLTMVWWVLDQGASELSVTLLVLSIFVPLNAGVIVSGVAVAKFGARRLLLISKALALLGAIMCFVLLATKTMTLLLLALIAIFVYGSMGPSMTADVSRAPAMVRLARRKLASFNAANGIVMVVGGVFGLTLGGYLSEGEDAPIALAISALLVGLSLVVTYASFPRDRIVQNSPTSSYGHLKLLTREVLNRLNGKVIGIGSVAVAIGLITVAEGFAEVVLPISLRNFDLPPTAMSNALALAVVGSVLAYLYAQAIHEKVKLDIALAWAGVFLCIALGIAATMGGWTAIVIGVVVTAAVADAAAMLAFTSIQEAMPPSLQAQAASLWYSAVLTASTVVIFLTGLTKGFGFVFMALIVVVVTAFSLLQILRGNSTPSD